MMVHLEVRLTHSEGALLRTLGLIQRRGYTVGELTLRGADAHQVLNLAIETNGRPVEVLGRQLQRLHDVEAVSHVDGEAWQATVGDCVRALASLLPAQAATAGLAATGTGR